MGLSYLAAYLVTFSALRVRVSDAHVLLGGAASGTRRGASALSLCPPIGCPSVLPAQTSAPPFWVPQYAVSLPQEHSPLLTAGSRPQRHTAAWHPAPSWVVMLCILAYLLAF